MGKSNIRERRALTAFVVLILAAVLFAIVVVQKSRASQLSNASKEKYANVFTDRGKALKCAGLNGDLMRSAPSCGLELPSLNTPDMCIDGECLGGLDVTRLVNLSNDISDQHGILDTRFAALNQRLDSVEGRQRNKRELVQSRFDRLTSKVDKMDEKVTDLKGGIRKLDKAVTIRGGDKIYEHDGYRVHVFRESGILQVVSGGKADVLVVGGGGSGASRRGWPAGGGGGGAGGLVFKRSIQVAPGSHDVVVGKGGGGVTRWVNGKRGEDSVVFGITAVGGGGGLTSRGRAPDESDGGSGGGQRYARSGKGGSGIPGQGYAGGPSAHRHGGGGGGASEEGHSDHQGGNGVDLGNQFGTDVGDDGWFAGGGSGGRRNGSQVSGTRGGGGAGGVGRPNIRCEPGMDGSGGGGGGRCRSGDSSGGSGVVIVRYPMNDATRKQIHMENGVSGSYHGNNYGIRFSTSRDIVIRSATIQADRSGKVEFWLSEVSRPGRPHAKTLQKRRFDVESGKQNIDLHLRVKASSGADYALWYPKDEIGSSVRLVRTPTGNRFAYSNPGPVEFKGGVSTTNNSTPSRWYYLFNMLIEYN